jgi:hypothetical protein
LIYNYKEENMKEVDKDVADMIKSLKKYDMLAESVAPVLARKADVKEDSHLANGKKSKWSDDDGDIFKTSAEKAADKVKNAFKPKDKKEDDSEKVDEDSHLANGKKSRWSDDDGDIFKGTAEKTFDKVKNLVKPKDNEDDSEKVAEGVDPEVLEWMRRFAKLGKMSGY